MNSSSRDGYASEAGPSSFRRDHQLGSNLGVQGPQHVVDEARAEVLAGRPVRFYLEVVQHPILGRRRTEKDRRPLAHCPILRLHPFESRQTDEGWIEESLDLNGIEAPNFICAADLRDEAFRVPSSSRLPLPRSPDLTPHGPELLAPVPSQPKTSISSLLTESPSPALIGSDDDLFRVGSNSSSFRSRPFEPPQTHTHSAPSSLDMSSHMGAPPTRPGISPLKPHGSLDSNAGPVSPTSMTNPSTQSSLQTSSFSVSTGSSSSFIHIAKRNLAMHSQSGDSHSFSSKGVRRTASDRASPPDPELSVHSKSADLPLGKRQKAGQPERNLFGSLHVSGVKVPGPDGQLGIWFLFTDLTVRQEGTYTLRFRVFDLTAVDPTSSAPSPPMAEAISQPLKVFSPRNFPGLPKPTDLTEFFAKLGFKLNTRKNDRRARASSIDVSRAGSPEKRESGSASRFKER